MSLMELYSAMVAQEADRLAVNRRRELDKPADKPAIPQQAQPVVVQDSERIRALELENAEIKAGFSAFVNMLMRKGVIQRSDVEGIMKLPAALPPVSMGQVVVSVAPVQNRPSGKKRKGRRR